MNESERVRAWVDSKRYLCPYCQDTMIRHTSKSCRNCHTKARGTSYEDRTVAQLKEKHGRYWAGPVRENARRRYDGKKSCFVCGYDTHYEIAHIKAISSHADNSLISEINKKDNLVALYPNHHWEFDNGLLPLSFNG